MIKPIFFNFKKYPSGLLLAIQLFSLFLHPFVNEYSIFIIFFNITALLTSVWLVNRSPAITSVAWILFFPAILFTVLYFFLNNQYYLILAQLFEAILYFYTTYSLLKYMLSDDIVSTDELLSAANVFTLLAWAFALLYSICQFFYPGSIIGGSSNILKSWVELLFLSFSILSSTGYGDIILLHPVAKMIGTFEMFFGLMYMALIVSKLISLSNNIKK